MSNVLSEEALMVNTMVFLLIFSIDDKDTRGKRVRKKIVRNIKFKLAQFRNENNPTRYLELVNKASVILKEVSDATVEKSITPSAMLNLLYFKYPELVKELNISVRDKDNLTKAYTGINLTWQTVKYTNRLVEKIKEYLGIYIPVWVDEDIAS